MPVFTIAALLLAAAPPLPDGSAGTLLIGNKGEDSISFVDLATGREVARRDTGKNPHEIAISPDGRRAALVAYGGNSIDLFDIASREKTGTIDLGANQAPHGIVWLKDGRIVATTEKSDTIVVVGTDLKTVTAIPTGQKASHMVAVSPDAARAYVANMQSGSASVIDLKAGRKIADLPAGKEPEGLALTPDGRQLWVADRQGDVVRVFDTRSLKPLGEVAVGKNPIRIVVTPDGRTAITSNLGGGDLSLIDVASRKVTRTITLSGQQGAGQVTILLNADGSRLYVAETGIDRIAEVDLETGKLIGRLPAGKNGDGLAIAP